MYGFLVGLCTKMYGFLFSQKPLNCLFAANIFYWFHSCLTIQCPHPTKGCSKKLSGPEFTVLEREKHLGFFKFCFSAM